VDAQANTIGLLPVRVDQVLLAAATEQADEAARRAQQSRDQLRELEECSREESSSLAASAMSVTRAAAAAAAKRKPARAEAFGPEQPLAPLPSDAQPPKPRPEQRVHRDFAGADSPAAAVLARILGTSVQLTLQEMIALLEDPHMRAVMEACRSQAPSSAVSSSAVSCSSASAVGGSSSSSPPPPPNVWAQRAAKAAAPALDDPLVSVGATQPKPGAKTVAVDACTMPKIDVHFDASFSSAVCVEAEVDSGALVDVISEDVLKAQRAVLERNGAKVLPIEPMSVRTFSNKAETATAIVFDAPLFIGQARYPRTLVVVPNAKHDLLLGGAFITKYEVSWTLKPQPRVALGVPRDHMLRTCPYWWHYQCVPARMTYKVLQLPLRTV
jgi:hypothetical protein